MLVIAVKCHIAGHTCGALVAFIINHRHAVAGVAHAHAAGLGRPANAVAWLAIHGAVADDVIDLGLPEHFIPSDAEFIAAIRKHRIAHGFYEDAAEWNVPFDEEETPELDDELAKKYGAEDLAALKGQISERLEAEYKGAARAVLKRALLDQLDAQVKFDLPPALVDAEAAQIAHQLWHEEHPDVHDHNHGNMEPTEEHKKLAERRVRLGLVLAEVGRKAEVTVSDAEMTQAVLAQARQYPGQERQYFEFVQKNQQMQQQAAIDAQVAAQVAAQTAAAAPAPVASVSCAGGGDW